MTDVVPSRDNPVASSRESVNNASRLVDCYLKDTYHFCLFINKVSYKKSAVSGISFMFDFFSEFISKGRIGF